MSEEILQQLANNYIENIKNLISLLKDKIVVFDFDGVLVKFKYDNNKILPCKNAELFEYCKTHSLYDNSQHLKTMQYIISMLNPDNIYVLTVSIDTIKTSKNKKIISSFNILQDHIIHVSEPAKKSEELHKIYNKTNRQIIFIEDTDKTLIAAEENCDFVKGVHISSLLA